MVTDDQLHASFKNVQVTFQYYHKMTFEPLLEWKTEILEKSQSLASQSAYTFRQLWDKVLLYRPNFKLCWKDSILKWWDRVNTCYSSCHWYCQTWWRWWSVPHIYKSTSHLVSNEIAHSKFSCLEKEVQTSLHHL